MVDWMLPASPAKEPIAAGLSGDVREGGTTHQIRSASARLCRLLLLFARVARRTPQRRSEAIAQLRDVVAGRPLEDP